MRNLIRLAVWFPFWWYVEKPKWFLRFAKNLAIALNRQFAVSLMFKLWLMPLFGDPNLVGHAIALVFRTFRVVIGLVVIVTSELFLWTSFLFWMVLPLFLFSRFFWADLGLILAVFVWFVRAYSNLPQKKIESSENLKDSPYLFLRPSLAGLLVESKDNPEIFNKILHRRVPRRLILKLGFATPEDFLAATINKIEKITGVPVESLLSESLNLAFELGAKYISSVHFVLAILKSLDFKFDEMKEVLLWSNRDYDRRHPAHVWEEDYVTAGLGGFNRSWTGRVTYDLDKYSRDLTPEAQLGHLPVLVGKEKPLADALRVLERESKSSIVLVGAPGCGKTTLVYGIAQEIVRGTNSPGLEDKRLLMLDLSKLQAGCKTTGEIQERLEQVLDDIESSGNIILFIDEIHKAMAAGGGVDVSVVFSTLEPRLGTSGYQVIGATSWENYRKYIEPNEAFSRLFERVEIPEATFEETLLILEHLSDNLEVKTKLVITLDSLKSSIELSRRYIYEKVLPDKAVDILAETVSYVRALNRQNHLVLKEDVERIVSDKTKIPIMAINPEESASLLNLEEKIHSRLVNQAEAVLAVSNAIRRSRVGLRDEKRPITSLLFVGPTGVGKTETAKALAEVFYGHEERMIRFDMSEFQTEASVETMIQKLTDSVRRTPFSLVLFDEAEKASRRLLDIFLQVVDEGRLTDVLGHTVSFANCIIIFTSNAGTSFIFESLRMGKTIDDFKNDLFKRLESDFRIEFLNRFDGIVVYKPLSREHIEMVARFKLGRIVKDMEKQSYKIAFSEDLIKKIAFEGFDPALGARPMRRLIQDKVEATLAKKILAGEIKKEELVTIDSTILNI